MKKFTTILLIYFLAFSTFAQETCSRVAIINHQEVLIDSNSTQKGEGLRFYLEKDEEAKKYLDIYQAGAGPSWQSAAIGTAGTGLVLSSFMINTSSQSRKAMILGGVSLILVNFLIAKTLEITNKKNLIRAIDEYNKRNLPRIEFEGAQNEFGRSEKADTFAISKSWSF